MRWLDLLFPPRCPFCDVVMQVSGVCDSCMKKLVFVTDPFCMKCGKQLERAEEEYCNDCMKTKHLFQKGRSLLVYEDLVRHSIYRYKYGKRKEYARVYGFLLKNHLEEFICQTKADCFVPVPLHKKRFRKRGYNQAKLLAKALEKQVGIPCRDDWVKRIKNTRPQKELDALTRQNNLKKAFKITGNDVKLKTIILIDDIYTTGSTIDALTQAFLSAGAREVYFITLASGR